MSRIIGFRFVDGEYLGKEYHKCNIFISDEKDNDFGLCTRVIKLKREYIDSLCNKYGIHYADLLDKNVGQIYYDQYGNIIEFNLE